MHLNFIPNKWKKIQVYHAAVAVVQYLNYNLFPKINLQQNKNKNPSIFSKLKSGDRCTH